MGIALGAINGAFNLDVALSALESTGRGRLLSTPRVSTQNNVEAEMTQGVQRTSADGSIGLGLYIAAQVVRAHGGRITVESTQEAGTTFSARMPRQPAH